MFEILLIVAAVVGVAKIADADNQSAFAWGIVTLLLCVASLLIPLPLLRIVIALVVAIIAMIGYKFVRGGRW